MEKKTINIEELVNVLVQQSGLDQKELSRITKISRQTLSNWKRGGNRRIAPESINKLEKALGQNPSWGIRLGSISNSKVEIVYTGRDSENQKQTSDGDSELIRKLLRENFELKEKLAQLEAKKMK